MHRCKHIEAFKKRAGFGYTYVDEGLQVVSNSYLKQSYH